MEIGRNAIVIGSLITAILMFRLFHRCYGQAGRLRAAGFAGILLAAYWFAFYLFALRDLYKAHPAAGDLFKFTAPAALSLNLAFAVTVAAALFTLPPEARYRSLAILSVHVAPVFAAAVFAWWLFFSLKI